RGIISEATGVVTEIVDFFGSRGVEAQGGDGVAESLFEMFLKQTVGIVSLKQFRDAETPDYACYQAVVKTDFVIDKWHKRAVLPGKYATKILPEASMPIVDALGLKVDEHGLVESLQPFTMSYDCTVTTGTNVFIAGGKSPKPPRR
ncbi:MAG TPA: hypothetical protein VEY88_25595, partial [Archangium sp.]|nr:hypothetical protein [Archangium sp.]